MNSFTLTSLSPLPNSGFGDATTTAPQAVRLLTLASITTPLQTTSLPPKAALAILDQQIFLLYNATVTPNTAVITLRTGPKSYIKLRGIGAAPIPPSGGNWVSVGKTALLYLNQSDIQREIDVHCQNSTKFGSPESIQRALSEFLKNREASITLVTGQCGPNGYKLTTEMTPSGNFRVAEKKLTEGGTIKLVYEDLNRLYGEPPIVRAKLNKNYVTQTDYVNEFRNEAKNFSILAEKCVPNLLRATLVWGQDQEKLRLEMPLKNGGTLLQIAEFTGVLSTAERLERLRYGLCIADALRGMHTQGYTHNNVKLENCFITAQGSNAVLGALGGVQAIANKARSGTYPAPEYSTSSGTPFPAPASTQNDRWAFGLLLYELIYGRSKYQLGYNQGREAIIQNSRELVSQLHGSETGVDWCIRNLLSLDPCERPEMAQVHTCLLAATTV